MPEDTRTAPTVNGTYRKSIQLNAVLQAMAFIENNTGPSDIQSDLVFLAADLADEINTRLDILNHHSTQTQTPN